MQPPPALIGTPVRTVLPAGSTLWRVHRADSSARLFDPPRENAYGGGRFDTAAPASYGYLCASGERNTALAERFLPELKYSPGRRLLVRKRLAGQALSAIRTTTELNLLRLTSATDLAAVEHDEWLVTAGVNEYADTRAMGAWLHDNVPWAQGILWRSTVDMPQETLVLFGDRCPVDSVIPVPGLTEELDAADRLPWLVETLRPYGVDVERPHRRNPLVFLNYRTGDHDGALQMLQSELAARLGEDQVFRDSDSIPPGRRFQPVLLAGARGCAVLLVLVGRRWETLTGDDGVPLLHDPSDWVHREIVEATKRGRRIVPVIIGLRPRLREDTLPPALRHLANVEFLQLPSGFDRTDAARVADRLIAADPELQRVARECLDAR